MSYKESGVEWIGQIPTNWNTLSVSKAYEVTLGKMLQPNPNDERDVQVPYLKAMNVQDGFLNLDKIEEMYCSINELKNLSLEIGDLVVCEGGEVARSALIKEKLEGFIFQNSVHRVKGSEKGDTKFLHYLLVTLRASSFIHILVNKATIAHFTKDKFNSLKIALPNLSEQMKISDYLDTESDKIENLIKAKQKLITLLEQQRQSIITEAVTKGLNPNVKMKDPGVERIGEISETINLVKLKYLVATKITDGPHETPILKDEGIPFISAEAIKNGKVDFNYKRGYISLEDHEKFSRKCRPQKGDIFMVKSGATTGKIGLVETEEEFSIWSPLALIRADFSKVNNLFLYYCFYSSIFQMQVQTGWNYGTQQNIGMGVIENLFIPCPSIEEQNEIVNYLVMKDKEVISLIESTKKQIEKLKEYRQAQIYEAVTGKIDVCDMKLD